MRKQLIFFILKRLILISPFVSLAIFPYVFITSPVFAHEQYVLTGQQLNKDLADGGINVLSALNSPQNLQIAIFVGLGITIIAIIYFVFQYSSTGRWLDEKLTRLENVGHVLLRIALGASLIASAHFHAFMGPEIPVNKLPLGNLLIPIMYLIGILLFFGMFTRIVSLAGLIILVFATFVYGEYIITYLNYYGEYIALIIFGSYALSVDNKIFGISKLVEKYKDWELFLIRVTYGISVMYPAITIKLLHPKVIIDIVNQYHLNQIHWLFPSDPLLISLGTGCAQILVGLLIIVGFETRLASLVTFFLYFLSIIYFKEAVWPHFVLLALAAYLVINNGGKFGLDHFIGRMLNTRHRILSEVKL